MPAEEDQMEVARPVYRWRTGRRLAAGLSIVALALGPAAACSSGSQDRADGGGDDAIVIEWARTDLGFGRAADCLGPYLAGVDLDGATVDDLRRERLDAVPLPARQRIGDALVVCGISESDR